MRKYAHQSGLDFSQMSRDDRFQKIENLAEQLMAAIKKVILILPVALVAAIMRASDNQGLSAFEVQA